MHKQIDLFTQWKPKATQTVAIGDIRREVSCVCLPAGGSLTATLAADGEGILELTELHRPTDGAFGYEVLVDGKQIAVRTMEPLSNTLAPYFVPLSAGKELTLRNLTDTAVYLAGAYLHGDPQAVQAEYLTPMEIGLCFPKLTFCDEAKDLEMLEKIKADLGCLTNHTVAVGIEIKFMNLNDAELEERFRYIIRLAQTVGIRLIYNFNSWWDGTPNCRDGKGGYFNDVEYQQVVYDPLNGVKKLSVPNMWSSTPWMTMNHPHLNKIRGLRLSAAMEILKRISAETLANEGKAPGYRLFIDNEPTYWSEFAYCQSPECGGDYNEHAIADARKDGVDLEPQGELRMEQRKWLLKNLSTYISDVSRVYRDCATAEYGVKTADGVLYADHELAENVYTHIFPHAGYPLADDRHLHYEEHVTQYARLGIEASGWQDDRWLMYAAGTGRWSQVNAERCCYADSAFHHQMYSHGAVCDIIFNFFYDQDVAAFRELDKLDDAVATMPQFGRQVMRYCAYTREMTGGEIVAQDNIEVAPLRERWVLRPAALGQGSITFRAGNTAQYPFGGWLEILGLIRPQNGEVSVDVGTSLDTMKRLAVLPSRDADFQREPLRLPLDEVLTQPDADIYVRLNMEGCFYDDWAQMNAVWDIRTVAALAADVPAAVALPLPLSRALHTMAALRQDCLRLMQQYPAAVTKAAEEALAQGACKQAYDRLMHEISVQNTNRFVEAGQSVTAAPLNGVLTGTFSGYDGANLRFVTHDAAASAYQDHLTVACPADIPVNLQASAITGDMLNHISSNPYTPAAITNARIDANPTVQSLKAGDMVRLTVADGTVTAIEAVRGLARGKVVEIQPIAVSAPMHNGYLTVETAPGQRHRFELAFQTHLNYTKAPAHNAMLCPAGTFGLEVGSVVLISFEPETVDNRPYRALEITVI